MRTGSDPTFTPGVESWASPISSSTLLGDDGISGSKPCSTTPDHRPSVIEKELSTGSDSEISTTNFVALRPLYSSVSQAISEHGPPSRSELKLVQRSRKGHRKSRQGCFNCKRRKIKVSTVFCDIVISVQVLTQSKCQETLPACDNCIRKELVCKYPAIKVPSLLQVCSGGAGSSLVPVPLQTTPIFSLIDMRFFHHFVFTAYPHLPVGNDAVWVRRVPAVAYHVSFPIRFSLFCFI